jgi:hypothetical protein
VTISETLWRDNADLAEAAMRHPFVRGLADGTLLRERFADFIAQDASTPVQRQAQFSKSPRLFAHTVIREQTDPRRRRPARGPQAACWLHTPEEYGGIEYGGLPVSVYVMATAPSIYSDVWRRVHPRRNVTVTIIRVAGQGFRHPHRR